MKKSLISYKSLMSEISHIGERKVSREIYHVSSYKQKILEINISCSKYSEIKI